MDALKNEEEKKLLYRVRDGDKDAFQDIYQLYYPKLRANFLKFVKAPQYAEDIVQDVFLKLWEIRGSIDPEKYFSGYIFTITRNLIFKFFRTAAHSEELVDDVLISYLPGDGNVQELSEWKELNNQIQKAVQLLPPKRQEVFLLCREENLTYEQVSRQLGISRNTIKEHMVQAMKFIREHLKAQSIISISAPLMALLVLGV